MKNNFNKFKEVTIFIFLLFIFVSIPFAFQSCEQEFIETPNNVVAFPDEISAIFNTPLNSSNITCVTSSCHSSENNANGMDLVDWNKAMNGSNNGTMIIPHNGLWSHLISYVNSDTNLAPVSVDSLFPEFHKISQEKVLTLYNWINEGAKSKDGQVAFTNTSINDKGFITNQAADVVAVVKQYTRQVIRLVPVGNRPNNLDAAHYVKISPDKNYFYISLIQEGNIEKFDANNYSKLAIMPAGQSPAHIEISPDGLTGYVTNFESSGSVTTTRKFNTTDMTVTDVFSETRMKGPHGMALTNDGNFLFVSSEIGEYLFKINTSTFYASDSTYIKAPVDPSVPPSGNGTGNFKPYQILLSPDENFLFATCRGSNEVRVYNSDDLSWVKNIYLGANAYPLLMNFTPDGNYLFVCNRNNNTVSVIKTFTQELHTTIANVGIQPHGVDFTADGQFAYIACETQSGFDGHHPTVGSNKVGVTRIIKVSDFSLQTNVRVEMGSFPAGIEIVK